MSYPLEEGGHGRGLGPEDVFAGILHHGAGGSPGRPDGRWKLCGEEDRAGEQIR